MNHSILLSQHSMTNAVVCASCPETYHDRVAELCLQHQVQKAFRKAGDTLNKRRGKGWIPKWEAKVVMATVTKAQTLNTNKARILCIAGDKNCGAEMASQPARVRAIKTGMANQVYRVRVELIEIREFLERYLGDHKLCSLSWRWGPCAHQTCWDRGFGYCRRGSATGQHWLHRAGWPWFGWLQRLWYLPTYGST